jgi:hypothetical protein
MQTSDPKHSTEEYLGNVRAGGRPVLKLLRFLTKYIEGVNRIRLIQDSVHWRWFLAVMNPLVPCKNNLSTSWVTTSISINILHHGILLIFILNRNQKWRIIPFWDPFYWRGCILGTMYFAYCYCSTCRSTHCPSITLPWNFICLELILLTLLILLIPVFCCSRGAGYWRLRRCCLMFVVQRRSNLSISVACQGKMQTSQ